MEQQHIIFEDVRGNPWTVTKDPTGYVAKRTYGGGPSRIPHGRTLTELFNAINSDIVYVKVVYEDKTVGFAGIIYETFEGTLEDAKSYYARHSGLWPVESVELFDCQWPAKPQIQGDQ